ncbi:MAG: alpha/beta hydrolase-fold protein [Longimicrobiales bacterium]
MLETRVHTPEDAGRGTPVVLLMHGRGADLTDLIPLGRAFPDRVARVFPRAPHPGAPWGYGPGRAWYRYEGGDRPEEESFRVAQAALDELFEGLPTLLGFEPGPVVPGGFSQGGTMAIGYALRHPGKVPGVLNFSGFVPSHPDLEVTPETVADTAFWWGHGTRDPAVAYEPLAVRGREALREAGARLEPRDYPMGHGIIPEELEDAVAWLAGVLEGNDA